MSARTFIDTNVLVYAHDITAGRKREVAKQLLEDLWRENKGCLSVQVLQELYVTLTRKRNLTTPQVARQLVLTYGNWPTHQPNANDVLAAIDLHQKSHISFWDAMVIQSAARLDCVQVFSEDLNHGQVVSGVTVTNPFEGIL